MTGPLADGARVVIIGGGPGGTACALALQRLGLEMGRRLQLTIVEGKEFSGERHYNQCAGVLSPPLPALLVEQLGVPFPQHLSRGELPGYVLHASGEEIVLDGHVEPSVAMRRVQFDAYMLETARQRGIAVVPARAVDLEFHQDEVMVYTESSPLPADVVVGAFGLDEGSAALFSRLTPYRPPRALASVVTKYHPGPDGMERFGRRIHAYLPADPRIEFGAITPKGNHLTINIAGQHATTPLMNAFLALPEVRAALPNLDQAGAYDPADLRFFKGRFPRSLAHAYYGDRYVMVGDAAGLVRAFKGKGVSAAVLTATRAAETMLRQGISRQAFHNHYCPANHDITGDLPYGRTVRLLTINMARFGLMRPVLQAAKQEPGLRLALFEAVSGDAPYREVVGHILRLPALLSLARCALPRYTFSTRTRVS